MDTQEQLWILRTHRRWITVFCLCATLAAFLLSYTIADRYDATALVLVKPYAYSTIASNKNTKDQLLSFPVGGGLPKAEIPSNTYVEIIRSPAIAEKVVQSLKLGEQADADATSESAGDQFRAYLKRQLRSFKYFALPLIKYGRLMDPPSGVEIARDNYERSISLNPIKDAYQFTITYTADDPLQAARVANATADLFVEFMGEMNMGEVESTLAFLKERLDDSESRLLLASEALRKFKEANKMIAYTEETEAEIRLVADLQATLERTDAKLAGLRQQYTAQSMKVLGMQSERDRLVQALEQRKKSSRLLPEKESQLERLKLQLRVADEIFQLEGKEYEDVKLRTKSGNAEVRVVARAIPPHYPSGPVKAKYAAIAFAMSLLLGVLIACLIEYAKNTVNSIAQAERTLGMRVLATLPDNGAPIAAPLARLGPDPRPR